MNFKQATDSDAVEDLKKRQHLPQQQEDFEDIDKVDRQLHEFATSNAPVCLESDSNSALDDNVRAYARYWTCDGECHLLFSFQLFFIIFIS